MHLFTCTASKGTGGLRRGRLVWASEGRAPDERNVEGDQIFLRRLDERGDFFSLKLRYRAKARRSGFWRRDSARRGVREKTRLRSTETAPGGRAGPEGPRVRAFQGQCYRLVDFAVDSETLEPTVVLPSARRRAQALGASGEDVLETCPRGVYLCPRFRPSKNDLSPSAVTSVFRPPRKRMKWDARRRRGGVAAERLCERHLPVAGRRGKDITWFRPIRACPEAGRFSHSEVLGQDAPQRALRL